MPIIVQENVGENDPEPEEIPGEPSMEEKYQEGRNQAYDRMTREEVPKEEIVHKKYLGGRLVEFGDHCWRKEAKKTKRGIHIIGTMHSNEIKTHNLVAKEAKIVRGQRRTDQEKLDAIIEVLISSKKCIVASFKSTDVIVPKICALQPKQHVISNVPNKVGYTLSLVFLPSKTCYRKLPKDIPDFILDCQCEPCEGPTDEAIDNNIQDYMGTGLFKSREYSALLLKSVTVAFYKNLNKTLWIWMLPMKRHNSIKKNYFPGSIRKWVSPGRSCSERNWICRF